MLINYMFTEVGFYIQGHFSKEECVIPRKHNIDDVCTYKHVRVCCFFKQALKEIMSCQNS